MKLVAVSLASAIAAFALLACESVFPKCDDPSKPCPPHDPDYPPLLATPEGACTNLERLGCPEAKTTPKGISCVHAFKRMSELTDPHYDCVASARDVAKVRTCGSVRCP